MKTMAHPGDKGTASTGRPSHRIGLWHGAPVKRSRWWSPALIPGVSGYSTAGLEGVLRKSPGRQRS